MKKVRKICVLVLVLSIIFMCFTFSACSAKSGNDMGYPEDYNKSGSVIPSGGDISSDIPIITTSDRMLAYYVNITVTVDDISEAMETVNNKVIELAGWQEGGERNYSSGRTRWVYRVPTDKINEFISAIQGTGNVSSKSVTTKDLTEVYKTATAEKSSLEARKEALINMLKREDITLEEEIQIESKLAEIDKELNRYNLSIDDYKQLSDYSTVTVVYYQAEAEMKEESFWDKLGDVFMGSGNSVGKVFGWILTAIVAILPYFAIIAGLFGLYVLIKFIVCKVKKIPFVLFKGMKERKAYAKRIKEKRRAEMKNKDDKSADEKEENKDDTNE